jgi:hypothetical protein
VIRYWTEADRRKLERFDTRPGWYAEGTHDGAAHYGVRCGGEVHAACGHRFVPIRNPMTGVVVVWSKPVERRHACSRCLALARA